MLLESVNAPARWWPCACLKCVSGLRRLEKTLNFFLRSIHIFGVVLKYALDINEGIWLQLFFYLIVLMGIVASDMGMSFFSAVFRVLDWSFLILHFDWNVCNWIPKWFDHEWIDFEVFVGKWLLSLTSYPLGLKTSKIAQLFVFFWRHQFFSKFTLRGILVCSLKMLFILALGFCNMDG